MTHQEDFKEAIEGAISSLYQGLNWSSLLELNSVLGEVNERVKPEKVARQLAALALKLSHHQLLVLAASIDHLTKDRAYSSKVFNAALVFSLGKTKVKRHLPLGELAKKLLEELKHNKRQIIGDRRHIGRVQFAEQWRV
ncbi:hypothetical protein HY546_00635 [archaeon]|nr:hypothetical protein [archaeon]